MASFNMQDFNEILEKCKDQSQQKEQDQVRCENSWTALINRLRMGIRDSLEGTDHDAVIYF